MLQTVPLNLIKKSKLSLPSKLINNSQTTIDLIEKQFPDNDLSCYTCTTDDDATCEQVNLTRNSEFVKKCRPDEFYCSVLRIEYKVVKEANWTLWVLERGCHRTCDPICIQLGNFNICVFFF